MIQKFFSYTEGRHIEWLELNLLKNHRAISKSTIISQIPQVDEEVVDSWISELMERNDSFPTSFYKLIGNTIHPNIAWTDFPEYFLCLYFSYAGASNDPDGTKLFERISANAIKNYIGGDIYTFGFPSNKNLNDFLDEISPIFNEKRGVLANIDYKDDGVDVLCCKKFGDNKSSNLYVLLQCAAGINWKSKKSINIDRWITYILWSSRNILTSISTTDYISEKQWTKSASDYGMLLDRNRILNWYTKSIDKNLRQDVLVWCSSKVA